MGPGSRKKGLELMKPRIQPVSPENATPVQKQLLDGWWRDLNFSRVLVNHPELYRVYVPVIAKVIPQSDLPPRDREIIALRVLACCKEVYEATHHASIARHAGLTDADIEAARTNGPSLTPFEKRLVKATDELLTDYRIADDTWRALGERYSQVQLMEVVGLVGCYVMLAMIMKSFDVQLEDKETFERCQRARGYT